MAGETSWNLELKVFWRKEILGFFIYFIFIFYFTYLHVYISVIVIVILNTNSSDLKDTALRAFISGYSL